MFLCSAQTIQIYAWLQSNFCVCAHRAMALCCACKRSRIEIKEIQISITDLKKKGEKKVILLKKETPQTIALLSLLPLFWYFGTPHFNIYLFTLKRRTRKNGGEKIMIKKHIRRKIFKAIESQKTRWKGP